MKYNVVEDYSAVYKLNTRVYSGPTYSLVSDMLDKALERLPEHQLLMHTDQDWHYQMNKYCPALESRGVVQSMSRKENCYDNSVKVNFFDIMKSEFLYMREFESIEHFKIELEKYINYYNMKRIKAKLKTSPVQYRTRLPKQPNEITKLTYFELTI